jgi:hypothetical protein
VLISGLPSTSLNISFEEFQFEALSPDGISLLHTSSSNDSLGYDITTTTLSWQTALKAAKHDVVAQQ